MTFTIANLGIVLLIFAIVPSAADHCAAVPAHVRHGCKMVAQIWTEARRAEAMGRIVTADELPPPSIGIGLPCFRDATREEQEAQPPPKVAAERYACLNMTCLCPFFGGISAAHDHCALTGGWAWTTPTNGGRTIGTTATAVPTPTSGGRTIDTTATAMPATARGRRQAGTPNLGLGRAVRMEYRVLSDNQRARFHAALLQLKRGFGSYEYDRLSFLHSNPNLMPSAHGGPTFVLWHREFLKRFEIALRAIDPSVAIPYWDSSLDGRLPNPVDSIMWSSFLVGTPTAAGTVADGPFAGWVTPSGGPIRRQLGAAGALFTEQEIVSIIRTPQMSNILAFTGRQNGGGCPVLFNAGNVLEFVHNNVHTWVGGDMGPLTTSPQDPIFFLHHSFIDYLFEQWRQLNQNRQQRETQYPDDAQILACAGSPNYRLNATMLPFQDPVVLNGAGLSNSYTDSLYTYAPRPTCRAAGGCGSRFLFCDTTRGAPSCVSKIRPGGDCSIFVGNSEEPCFGTSTCANGRCSGGAQRVARSTYQRKGYFGYAGNKTSSAHPVGPTTAPRFYQYVTTPSPTVKPTTAPPFYQYATTPSPTPAPPKDRVCYDNHECCAQWAARGACRSAPRHMNTWCPVTCRFDGCRPQATERAAGRDYHSQCKRWSTFHEKYGRPEGWRSYSPNRVLRREKLRNECERNPHWMACNCPEACSGMKRNWADCSANMPKDYVLAPVGAN